MSFNSPSKQERIERHLMRQRGAGVRTVSTSFGFAFGSQSDQASSVATPARDIEEPPAKKRKTVLSDELVIPGASVSKSVKATTTKKVAKSRRRFPLDDEDAIPKYGPAGADDSFVAAFGSKKVPNKKAASNSECVLKDEVEVPQTKVIEVAKPTAAPKSRPRRQAAAEAASKVTEDLQEETTSIDKKRRDPVLAKKPSRPRGKIIVAPSATAQEATQNPQAEKSTTITVKISPKRRQATKSAKTRPAKHSAEEVVGAVEADEDELAPDVTSGSQAKIRAASKAAGSRQTTSKAQSISKSRKAPAKKRKRQTSESADAVQLPVDVACEVPSDPSRNQQTMGSEKDEVSPRRNRRPLAEADVNITLHSASPEKTAKEPSKASKRPSQPKPKQRAKPLALYHSSPDKQIPNKMRKLDIKHDAMESGNLEAGTTSLADHIPGTEDTKESSLDRAAAHMSGSADPHVRPTVVKRRRKLIHEDVDAKQSSSRHQTSEERSVRTIKESTAKGKGRAAVSRDDAATSSAFASTADEVGVNALDRTAASRTTETKEEDVDWLFAPQAQGATSNRPVSKPRASNADKKRSKFKLPEMDLDDLLSNIASFAQDKAQNVTLFAGGEKKSRMGSRKKAKV